MALLEADVNVGSSRCFSTACAEGWAGTSLEPDPGQQIVGIVRDESGLWRRRGRADQFASQLPTIIFLVGLRAGKTTTAAKLGLWR
jgi:signal recognition particle GTPase